MDELSAPVTAGRPEPASATPIAGLVATGISKSYRRGIWFRRRELPVLRGADLVVGAGEVVGLVGENGSARAPS